MNDANRSVGSIGVSDQQEIFLRSQKDGSTLREQWPDRRSRTISPLSPTLSYHDPAAREVAPTELEDTLSQSAMATSPLKSDDDVVVVSEPSQRFPVDESVCGYKTRRQSNKGSAAMVEDGVAANDECLEKLKQDSSEAVLAVSCDVGRWSCVPGTKRSYSNCSEEMQPRTPDDVEQFSDDILEADPIVCTPADQTVRRVANVTPRRKRRKHSASSRAQAESPGTALAHILQRARERAST